MRANTCILLGVALILLAASAVASNLNEAKHYSEENKGKHSGYASRKEGALNVHLICHTHDDVGWLKTVDQYYVGSNNTIQHAGVEYVLDSVIDHLVKNPNHKFEYVEQAFFQRWWRAQSTVRQESVRVLVRNNQLSFINGAYCMHDEAATHYLGMLDQTTVGHRLLKEMFDYPVRVGWQIDPFGHSSTQASLLSAEAGFEALYFARMDYQDRQLRYNRSDLEFVWRASQNNPENSQIFTGQFIAGHYEAPKGFCFDLLCADPVIQNDPRLFDYNVKERVDTFVNIMYEYFAHSKGEDIMLTMGSDFHYENANAWFKNLDKLIQHVNEDGRVNVFYSTALDYTRSKLKSMNKKFESTKSSKAAWTVKTDDFFPYSDCPHCMWTGYFTSRSPLKRLIRIGDSFLQAAKQHEVLFGEGGKGQEHESLTLFKEEMAIAQHHDAATGTSRQHVACDYAKRIDLGITGSTTRMMNLFTEYIKKKQLPTSAAPAPAPAPAVADGHVSKHGGPSNKRHSNTTSTITSTVAGPAFKVSTMEPPVFSPCPLANMSICDASTKGGFVVTVYNSVSRSRKQAVRVPVSDTYLQVLDKNGNQIACDITDAFNHDANVPGSQKYTLHFIASAESLGYSTYFVVTSSSAAYVYPSYATFPRANDVKVNSSYMSITLDARTGLLSAVETVYDRTKVDVTHQYGYYPSYVRPQNTDEQNSGAYIFRPAQQSVTIIPPPSSVAMFKGRVMTEVRYDVKDDLRMRRAMRMYDLPNADIEFEWTMKPVPIDDNVGKEIVSIFSSNMTTKGTFYTDSNGREFQRRELNYRPTWPLEVFEPVAGNYYPVSVAAYLKDAYTETVLGVTTDRNQGAASLRNGHMEFMIQRRILADDARGVEEPLNETQSMTPWPEFKRIGEGITVTGSHWLTVSPKRLALGDVREEMSQRFNPFWLTFGRLPSDSVTAVTDYITSFNTAFKGTTVDLDPRVEVLTLEPWIERKALLRLGHMYSVGEHPVYSQPITIDMLNFFSGKTIASFVEASLTGTRTKDEIDRDRAEYTRVNTIEADGQIRNTGFTPSQKKEGVASTTVTLNPMEIKTFWVEFA